MLASISALKFPKVGIKTKPNRFFCDQSEKNIVAYSINLLENHETSRGIAENSRVFLVVSLDRTTFYGVFMTDLGIQQIYEDSTRFLVHPDLADLNGDERYHHVDVAFWFSAWPTGLSRKDTDANCDGRSNRLDWFYLCNFKDSPPNKPPPLTLSQNQLTIFPSEEAEDAEQAAGAHLHDTAARGSVVIFDKAIPFRSDSGAVNHDPFTPIATAGLSTTLPTEVAADSVRKNPRANIKRDLLPIHCPNSQIATRKCGRNLGT